MSNPAEADDVKLIASLFSPQEELIGEVTRQLEALFGTTDWVSPALFFDRTRYYAREMGWPLHRRFVSFKALIRPDDLADIKLKTNDIEKHCLAEGNRKINLDPGYVALERLVLATGKNYTHRIYLHSGIYADLTLVYHKESFRPLNWTYKDYADPQVIGFFNVIRERYKRQLRGLEIED